MGMYPRPTVHATAEVRPVSPGGWWFLWEAKGTEPPRNARTFRRNKAYLEVRDT